MRAMICVLLLLFPLGATAREMPLTYSLSQLSIMRYGLKQDPSLLPWQKQKAMEESKLHFEVEVRDGRLLYGQHGWFNLTSYDDNKGVLMAFERPVRTPIIPSNQYAPVDILFLDAEGKVIQIVPNIQLAELRQELMPASPVLAFLFLRAGICEKLVITPGDVVEYEIFRPSPVVLGAPGAAQAGGGGTVMLLQDPEPAPTPAPAAPAPSAPAVVQP